jgi:hypothetical protein
MQYNLRRNKKYPIRRLLPEALFASSAAATAPLASAAAPLAVAPLVTSAALSAAAPLAVAPLVTFVLPAKRKTCRPCLRLRGPRQKKTHAVPAFTAVVPATNTIMTLKS